MAWSGVPCSLRSDPRLFIGDRRAAFAAVCAAYLYSSEHETDGRTPRSILEEFAPAAALARLIAAGVLREVGDDVEVVAFLDTNPTHASRETIRERDREKKRAARSRSVGDCPQGTPKWTPTGSPTRTPFGSPHATAQHSTTQQITSCSAPSERSAAPATDAPGAIETKPTRGKGKTRRKNPDATAAPPRKRSEAQEVWDHYVARYVQRHGEKPLPQAHFFVQLERRIKAGLTVAKGKAHVDRYFDNPPFALRDGARDFGRLLGRWDMLAPEGPPPVAAPPERFIPPIYTEERSSADRSTNDRRSEANGAHR